MKRFSKAKEIKVGVVGYGGAFNMGRSHLWQMKAAGMTPVAVAEIDPARLKVAAEEFPGIETYTTVTEMLKKSDVNLIVIITPHNTHAKLTLLCLRAGRHVVCEKPLAITTAECDAMLAAGKKNNVLVTAYHNRHWDGCILQAVKTIKSGKIGDIIRIECHMGGYRQPADWWRSSKPISGGILYDWGVHLLEYSLQLIHSEIDEVSGFAREGFWAPKIKWKSDANEDEGFLLCRFKSGQWLSLMITDIDSHPKAGQLEITGTKGSYIFSGGDWTMVTHENGVTVRREGKNPAGQQDKFYKNIADHLTKGTPLIITPEWSRRPIHIIDLGVQSAKKKKAMKAKHP